MIRLGYLSAVLGAGLFGEVYVISGQDFLTVSFLKCETRFWWVFGFCEKLPTNPKSPHVVATPTHLPRTSFDSSSAFLFLSKTQATAKTTKVLFQCTSYGDKSFSVGKQLLCGGGVLSNLACPCILQRSSFTTQSYG